MTIYLDKYCIVDNFNISKWTDYLGLYSPYLQNYWSYFVVLSINLKLKKPSLMVNFRTEHPFCVLSHVYMHEYKYVWYVYMYVGLCIHVHVCRPVYVCSSIIKSPHSLKLRKINSIPVLMTYFSLAIILRTELNVLKAGQDETYTARAKTGVKYCLV